MNYYVQLTIPPLTLKADPVIQTVSIHAGTITDILVVMPKRTACLAHVTVREKAWQLVPWNQDGNIVGDGLAIDFPMDYEITDPPLELYVTGWNEDDTYQHTPKIKISVDEPKGKTIAQLLIGQ